LLVQVLVDDRVDGVPHLVAHRGVNEREELVLGRDLVVQQTFGDVYDFYKDFVNSILLVPLLLYLDIPRIFGYGLVDLGAIFMLVHAHDPEEPGADVFELEEVLDAEEGALRWLAAFRVELFEDLRLYNVLLPLLAYVLTLEVRGLLEQDIEWFVEVADFVVVLEQDH